MVVRAVMKAVVKVVMKGGRNGEGDEGGDGLGGLAQYNLDAPTMQAIQALVSNPSFPMIRQRMI